MSTTAVDDDLVVVIVDKPKKKGRQAKSKAAKAKAKKSTTQKAKNKSLQVEKILENVERHGEQVGIEEVTVKVEKVDEDEYQEYEYLEEEEYIVPEFLETNEEQPQQDDIQTEAVENYYDIEGIPLYGKGPHRYTMVKPHERHSHIEDLRKKNPSLRKNKKALIEEIIKLMADQIKAPPVPENSFALLETGTYECKICKRNKKTKIAAIRHYQENHGPRFLLCYACGVDFRSCTNLYKHEKRCRAPDAALALQARALVIQRRDPARPFAQPKWPKNKGPAATRAAKQSYQCSQCAAQFSTRAALEPHERLHRGERPFVCADCGAAYTSKPALTRHMTYHEEKKFECDDCGFKAFTKSVISVHCASHMPSKKFPCSVAGCPKRYATRAAMQLHVDTAHLQLPPPLACQLCGQRFRRMYLLREHMLKLHNMHVITKKMFLKKSPKLWNTEVDEAKVVYIDDDAPQENESVQIPQKEEMKKLREELLKELNENLEKTNQDLKKETKTLKVKAYPNKPFRRGAKTGKVGNDAIENTQDGIDEEDRIYLNYDQDENQMLLDEAEGTTELIKYEVVKQENKDLDADKSVRVETLEEYHSAESLDVAPGNFEVIDNAESFGNFLKDSEKYQVFVIENGQVTKKVNLEDIKDQLFKEYREKNRQSMADDGEMTNSN